MSRANQLDSLESATMSPDRPQCRDHGQMMQSIGRIEGTITSMRDTMERIDSRVEAWTKDHPATPPTQPKPPEAPAVDKASSSKELVAAIAALIIAISSLLVGIKGQVSPIPQTTQSISQPSGGTK